MTNWIWIGLALALAIHDEQLAEHGGGEGVRDQGALESALARPKNLQSYAPKAPAIAALAAAYAFGIVRNHPFVDGNKRTSLVVAETFLRLNGYRVEVSKEEKYLTYERLAAGNVSEADLVTWFEKIVVPVRKAPSRSR